MTTHCIVVTGMAKATVMAGKAILTAVSSGPAATPRLTMSRESQRRRRDGTLQLVPAVTPLMPYPIRTSGVSLFACAPPAHAVATRAIATHQRGVRAKRSLTPADREPGTSRQAGLRPQVLVRWLSSAGEDVARCALAQGLATTFAAYVG